MVNRQYIWMVFGLLLFLACSKDEEVVATFEPGVFRKVEFNDSFEVRFYRSSEPKIVVRGNERFVDGVTIRLEGDSLMITNSVRASWLHPETNKVRLEIYADSLREIRANESCNLVSVDTLRSTSLTVIVGSKLNTADIKVNCEIFGYYNVFPCGGLMRFSGETDHLNMWNDALMEVHAFDLYTNTAYVENKGGGSCRIRVDADLSYAIFDRGDILLKGNPPGVNELADEGEGELIFLD